MPEWIHNREEHIKAKNSQMPESEAWAIATQQSHAAGKSPKGFGTAAGRHEAKQKYDEPKKSYEQTADPSGIGSESEKNASGYFSGSLVSGFVDELEKIAIAGMRPDGSPTALAEVRNVLPKNPLKMNQAKYTKVNTEAPASTSQQMQPLLAPPPVRT